MSDYIERQTVYSLAKKISDYVASGKYVPCLLGHKILDFVDDLPADDVVEVVRCKDCKYSEHWYRDKRLCRLWYGEEKPSAPIDVFDDGFCNYGERREDDG